VSRAAESFLHQAFPDLEVEIVPNGLDVARFAEAPQLAVGGSARCVAWVHRLDPQKAFPVLIEAWPEVLRAVPDARLLVAGDGPERGAVNGLEAAARARVAMFGRVPHDRVPEVFGAARVAVAAATGGESWGYTLVEAMAAGAAVVATDIDGYREVATDEVDALLVPPGDPHALAQALVRALQDDVLVERLVAAGRARAAGFDWSVVAARIEEVYARAVASAG
jgi:phosphatidylinositol alpha-mannosyltransferase